MSKAIGLFLILIGGVKLLDEFGFSYYLSRIEWNIVLPFVLIIAGIMSLKNTSLKLFVLGILIVILAGSVVSGRMLW